jgi:hypothetical protein
MNYVMNAIKGVLLRFYIFKHYEKKGVLQLALQFNFWVVKDICNSLYLYVMCANGQVAWVATFQLIVYMVQLIATPL